VGAEVMLIMAIGARLRHLGRFALAITTPLRGR